MADDNKVKYRDPVDKSQYIYQILLTGNQYCELLRIFLEADASSSVALRRQLGSGNVISFKYMEDNHG